MTRYSIELRTRKYVKGYGFFRSQDLYPTNMGKRLLDAATKTGIDAAETVLAKSNP